VTLPVRMARRSAGRTPAAFEPPCGLEKQPHPLRWGFALQQPQESRSRSRTLGLGEAENELLLYAACSRERSRSPAPPNEKSPAHEDRALVYLACGRDRLSDAHTDSYTSIFPERPERSLQNPFVSAARCLSRSVALS
jgi:hypothetical protein